MPDLWHQALTDGLTVIPSAIYPTLGRRYGLVIRGPHALLDFQRRLRMAKTLRVIGRDGSGARLTITLPTRPPRPEALAG